MWNNVVLGAREESKNEKNENKNSARTPSAHNERPPHPFAQFSFRSFCKWIENNIFSCGSGVTARHLSALYEYNNQKFATDSDSRADLDGVNVVLFAPRFSGKSGCLMCARGVLRAMCASTGAHSPHTFDVILRHAHFLLPLFIRNSLYF